MRRRTRPELSLWDLHCNADRAGLFCNWTPEPNTGCYLWTGGINNRGYGFVSLAGRTVLVHRCVFRLLDRDIEPEMEVHHACENSACINPRHLVALTPTQHKRVHLGLGRAWVEFIGAKSPDTFDALDVFMQGFIGLPFTPRVFDLGDDDAPEPIARLRAAAPEVAQ